eukprot:352563-Chlamydomonas_euryale.AAC.2
MSEDDSLQQNDAGAIVRGLCGKCGGPEDGIAPENSGGIVILIQASEGAMSVASAGLEITGGVSPPDRSVRALLARFGRPTRSNRSCPSSLARCHSTRGERRRRKTMLNSGQSKKHAAMLAHNKPNKRRTGMLGRGGWAHEQCPAACNCQRASGACAGDLRVKCDLFTRR